MWLMNDDWLLNVGDWTARVWWEADLTFSDRLIDWLIDWMLCNWWLMIDDRWLMIDEWWLIIEC